MRGRTRTYSHFSDRHLWTMAVQSWNFIDSPLRRLFSRCLEWTPLPDFLSRHLASILFFSSSGLFSVTDPSVLLHAVRISPSIRSASTTSKVIQSNAH